MPPAKNTIIERKGKFKRSILFRPGYDERRKGCGVHGMEMRFVVKGPRGAVQFLLFTNWMLPHVERELHDRYEKGESLNPCLFKGYPADLGYHSPKPMYKDQSAMRNDCDILGGQCYYDGSGLNAERPFGILVSQGLEALWKFLEEYYGSVFSKNEMKNRTCVNCGSAIPEADYRGGYCQPCCDKFGISQCRKCRQVVKAVTDGLCSGCKAK
jgi:hypothetical protein